MDATHALYLVVGRLAQQYDGAYGIVHIAIAGCLTTPGRTINLDVPRPQYISATIGRGCSYPFR